MMYPAFYAALGAALGYYGFPPLRDGFPLWPRFIPALVAVLALPVCLSWARGFPPRRDPLPGRRSRSRGRLALALAAGLWFGIAAAAAVPPPPRWGLPPGEIAGLSGVLREDPRSFADGRGMGSLALSATAGRGGLRASASGTVPVFFPAEALPRLRDFGRGAELYLEGRLLPGDRGPLFRAAAVHVVRPAPGPEQFRTALRLAVLEKLVPSQGEGEAPAWGPLAAALLLGVRDSLDTEMARSFRDAGCSHILALSGMHLAIISAVIAFFLRKALGLRAAALAGSLIIAAYVYLAGGQPSLVRAAIMYLLGVLSLLGNMKVRPLNLLSLAFLIQLAWDPGAGASLSFILSYLALGGILLTGEALHELLRGKIPAILAGGLSASAGAFLAGAAVVSLYFGVLRPVGILAGLLLMPLATVFMIGALGNLALCFIAPALAGPPGRLLSLLAGAQQALVTLAARAPGLPVPRPLPVLALSLLFAVLIGYGGWRRRLSRTSLAPFA